MDSGGKPTAITHFSAEPFNILSVAMSPEGKKLAITRQRLNTTNAVMMTNFR